MVLILFFLCLHSSQQGTLRDICFVFFFRDLLGVCISILSARGGWDGERAIPDGFLIVGSYFLILFPF